MDTLTSVIGAPDKQLPYWEMQGWVDNCAVAAEVSLINQFGHRLSQENANIISSTCGWYQKGQGTPFHHIGKLMDLFGIPNHSRRGATTDDLLHELASGRGIIVGLSTPALRGPHRDTPAPSPGSHAVVVTGFRSEHFIINNPGHDGGAGESYPKAQFEQAWDTCGRYYTATDLPLPSIRAAAAEEQSPGGYAFYGISNTGRIPSSPAGEEDYIESLFEDSDMIHFI